jgi:hypothetical protein
MRRVGRARVVLCPRQLGRDAPRSERQRDGAGRSPSQEVPRSLPRSVLFGPTRARLQQLEANAGQCLHIPSSRVQPPRDHGRRAQHDLAIADHQRVPPDIPVDQTQRVEPANRICRLDGELESVNERDRPGPGNKVAERLASGERAHVEYGTAIRPIRVARAGAGQTPVMTTSRAGHVNQNRYDTPRAKVSWSLWAVPSVSMKVSRLDRS